MTQTENHAKQQAVAQYDSVLSMVNALDLDWDRLQELRDERDNCVTADDEGNESPSEPGTWERLFPAEAQELAELEKIAGEWQDWDDVRRAIDEDPLEVSVRSGWATPHDALNPEEFRILLCTGGPAVQILGELDGNGQVSRAWLEYQDWGTPWTQYFDADSRILCRYAEEFFPGF